MIIPLLFFRDRIFYALFHRRHRFCDLSQVIVVISVLIHCPLQKVITRSRRGSGVRRHSSDAPSQQIIVTTVVVVAHSDQSAS